MKTLIDKPFVTRNLSYASFVLIVSSTLLNMGSLDLDIFIALNLMALKFFYESDDTHEIMSEQSYIQCPIITRQLFYAIMILIVTSSLLSLGILSAGVFGMINMYPLKHYFQARD